MLAYYIRLLVNTFFPQRCLLCQNAFLYDGDEGICKECKQPPPLPRLLSLPQGSCQVYPRFTYTPQIGRLLQQKYTKGIYGRARSATISRALGRALSDIDLPWHDIQAIVPLPMHWARRWWRGQNHTEYIAQGLNQKTGIPVLTTAVFRSKFNRAQVGLTRAQRLQNIKATDFEVNLAALQDIRTIVLIDDVISTGASLAACIHALKKVRPDIRIIPIVVAYNA